ncbi:G5 domain-containing protein [Actinomyces timonensis]|uniref:aggregation-promoting factor C-terminal-like domain-containing protein n=1 Tax=Actinomyces timonensis TaxID=1288391 RepID=UPI00031BAB32|nr:G5 domain-containing protein [Actinomyces timonensis]
MTPAPRKHILVRSGALAAAVAASVSGGAYAAVEATGDEALPLPSLTGGDLAQAAEAPTAEPDSTPAIGNDVPEAETATANAENVVVEDVTEAHGSTEEETDQLPKGEKKVKTAGVDGVTRTISRVTTDADGNELSREVVSTVAVTAKVDEVVLVGTKEEAAQAASKDSAGSGDSGSAAAASAPQAVSGTDAASAQATARSMMGAYGWGDSEFSCLVSLWNRESGWNYQAQNASSGAYGIPQALPGSKMASEGTDWATNPATQIKWGLGYIKGRYGSPCSAWSHSESTGWY